MFLFFPDSETNVISKGIGGCKWINAFCVVLKEVTKKDE